MSQFERSMEIIPVGESSVAEQESLRGTFQETLNQIEDAQSESEEIPRGRMEQVLERLGGEQGEVDAAKEVVRYEERVAALNEAQKTALDSFRIKVRSILLPITASLAMSNGPVLANEQPVSKGEKERVNPEFVVKPEQRELQPENVFDFQSPLAIRDKNLKLGSREMSSQELAVMRDFHQKAWEEQHEWIAIVGKEKNGEVSAAIAEGEQYMVRMYLRPFTLRRMQERSMTHTHPLRSDEVSGLLKEEILGGIQKPNVMPPSGGDILSCMHTRAMGLVDSNRVVDLRGVWQYECDPENPLAKEVTSARKILQDSVEGQGLVFGMSSEDRARMYHLFYKSEDAQDLFESLSKLVTQLDHTYPGFEKAIQGTLKEFIATQQKAKSTLLEYDEWGRWMARNSSQWSERDLKDRIQNYIEMGRPFGVSLSYTPFKAMPKLKKEE